MKFTLPIAASLALVLSSSPSALVEASPSMEPRNSANFGLTSSNCYGAPTKPWKSSAAPGWWLGTPCKKSLPQWDGGDFNLCNQWWSGFLPICYARQTPSNFNFCNQWWSSSIPFCRANNGGTNPITSKPCTTTTSISTSATATSTSTTSAAGSTPTSGTGTGSGTVCSDGYKQSFSNYTTVAQSGVYQGQVVGAATIDNANYLTYGLVDTLAQCMAVCDGISNCDFINLYQEFNSTIKDSYGPGKLTCAAYKACSSTEALTNYGGQDDPTYIVNSQGWCKSGSC